MTSGACDACLRQSALIAHLGPRLSAVLGGFDPRLASVLALDERDLIAAVAGRRADEARRFAADFEPDQARDAIGARGVGAVCRHADGYPGPLRALIDVPPVLYFTGGRERLRELTEGLAVTIVGTRTPSRYALDVAHDLGRGMAAAGVTIVSGLALGIDAAAHRGTLAAGGRPLAVLAGGVDHPYPKANRTLHARVGEQGALISELPPGQRPMRWSFPARNRIMAALGRLIVVVEAAESSGTLITAEFAAQLGRDVGAVPGQITARLAAGSNRLLREGAAVIRSPQDALDELLGVGSTGRFDRGGGGGEDRFTPAQARDGDERLWVDATFGSVAPSGSGALTAPAPPEPPIDAQLRRVLDLVEGGESVEAIGRDAGLAPGQARGALGRLELMGLVARDGFAGYVRTLAREDGVGRMLGEPLPMDARQ